MGGYRAGVQRRGNDETKEREGNRDQRTEDLEGQRSKADETGQ